MRKIVVALVVAVFAFSGCGPDKQTSQTNDPEKQCHVNGYTKSDGTKVRGYDRNC